MDTTKNTPNQAIAQPATATALHTKPQDKSCKGHPTSRLFKAKRAVDGLMKKELAGQPELLKAASEFRNKIWQAIREIEESSPISEMD